MTVALTKRETQALDRHERVIESGLKTFVEVGEALMAIRDARLYRASHSTFEDYCRERWGMSRSRAHRLIDASQAMAVLPIGNKPESESQARPLTKLPAADQPAGWQRAQEIAEANGEPVRARHVKAAVDEIIRQHTPPKSEFEQFLEDNEKKISPWDEHDRLWDICRDVEKVAVLSDDSLRAYVQDTPSGRALMREGKLEAAISALKAIFKKVERYHEKRAA